MASIVQDVACEVFVRRVVGSSEAGWREA
jgi:hypothetical protein